MQANLGNNNSNRIGSYAMLKSIWKDGDYLVPFERLLITFLIRNSVNSFDDIQNLCVQFQQYWHIDVPYMAMLFLLKRLEDKEYISKESHQRYKVLTQNVDANLIIPQADLDKYTAEYDLIIEDCINYIKKQYNTDLTYAEISQGFSSFLKHQATNILLGEYPFENGDLLEQKYYIANYIKDLHEHNEAKLDLLHDIAMRHIFACCLTMDQNSLPCSLNGLNVYLDTSVVFRYFGIDLVPGRRRIYQNLVRDLIKAGANVYVLQNNINEISNILNSASIYAPSDLYEPTLASETTTYFHDQNASAADITEINNNLINDLKMDGIDICPGYLYPDISQYCQDISKIQSQIKEVYKKRNPYLDYDEKEPSIYIDANAINLILCYREGRYSQNILETKHIFVTTNTSLAFAAQQFEQCEMGLPRGNISSCVSVEFIGLLTWLHKPAELLEMSQRHLLSLAYAAFLPSDRVIAEFDKQLKECIKRERISEDEYYIMRSAPIVRDILMQQCKGNLSNITIDTPVEIMAKIREEVRNEERGIQEAQRKREHRENELKGNIDKQQQIQKNLTSVEVSLDAIDTQISLLDGLELIYKRKYKEIRFFRSIFLGVLALLIGVAAIFLAYKYADIGGVLLAVIGIVVSVVTALFPYLYYAATNQSLPSPEEYFSIKNERLMSHCEKKTGYSASKHKQLRETREKLFEQSVEVHKELDIITKKISGSKEHLLDM